MACKIIFNTKNGAIEIETNFEQESDFNGLQTIAESLQSVDDATKKALIQQIGDALTKSELVDYNPNDVLVPTHTKDDLLIAFPDEDWGQDSDIPPVILVNDNKNIRSENFWGMQRVIQGANEVYVVPKANIKGFAMHIRLKNIIKKLNLESKELDALKELYDKKVKLELNSDIKKIDDKIKKYKEDLKNRYKKDKDAIEEKQKINRIQKQWLIPAQTALKELNQNENPKRPQIARRKILNDRIARWEKEIDELNKIIASKEAELDIKIKQIDSDYYNDETIKRFSNQLNNIKEKKNLPDINNLQEFLEHFITHQNDWITYLSLDTYYNVVREIRTLLGWNYNITTNDDLVLTMETAMKPYGKLKVLDIQTVKEYFKQRGIDIKKKPIESLVRFFYGQKSANYYLDSFDSKHLFFKRKYNSLVDELDFMSNTELLPQLEDRYKGFYIYSYEDKGVRKYFATNKPFSRNTKAPKKFLDKNDVIQYINNTYDKIPMYIFDHTDLQKASSDVSKITIRGQYKVGDIVATIDYTKGPYNLPYGYTMGQFEEFVNTTFDPDLAQDILAKMNTVDKAAIFYSHFARNASFYLNPTLYELYKDDVINVLDEIDSAQEILYAINTQVYNPFTHQSTMFVTKLPSNINDDTPSKKIQPVSTSFLTLQSMATIFNEHGIQVQILSNEDYIKRFGIEGHGFHDGGVIYLNASSASYGTLFHEYAHLLVGILKVKDPNSYQGLLMKLGELLKQPENVRLAQAYNSLKDRYAKLKVVQQLSEDEKELYYLEELFAEMYSKYLSVDQNINVSDLFGPVDEAVTSSTIFDNLTLPDLYKNATKPFMIIANLSSLVRNTKTKLGIGFDPDAKITQAANRFIDSNIGDTLQEGVIVENCK